MDEIGNAVSSPVWWLTSGLMAFAMSLLAYFVGPRLEGLLSLISKKARLRSERRTAQDRAAVERLSSSEFAQQHLWLHTLYGEFLSLKMMLVLILALGLVAVAGLGFDLAKTHPTAIRVLVGAGTVILLIVFGVHQKGFRNYELLREAWREWRNRGGQQAESGTE